ncbi:MAG TPA: hypothetical protein VMU26_31660 [Candidatus Polarisedimenticolia bacterium]|nr:hypothetical protein [Candidatus Polarisedimenticolia bacterium]
MKAVLSFVRRRAVFRILFAALASKTRNEDGLIIIGYWSTALRTAISGVASRDMKMDHRRSYVLTVKLDQIDPHTPDQMLVPKIEGGGNELA